MPADPRTLTPLQGEVLGKTVALESKGLLSAKETPPQHWGPKTGSQRKLGQWTPDMTLHQAGPDTRKGRLQFGQLLTKRLTSFMLLIPIKAFHFLSNRIKHWCKIITLIQRTKVWWIQHHLQMDRTKNANKWVVLKDHNSFSFIDFDKETFLQHSSFHTSRSFSFIFCHIFTYFHQMVINNLSLSTATEWTISPNSCFVAVMPNLMHLETGYSEVLKAKSYGKSPNPTGPTDGTRRETVHLPTRPDP